MSYIETRDAIFKATSEASTIIFQKKEYDAEVFTDAVAALEEIFERADRMSFIQDNAIRVYARVLQLAATLAQLELTDDIKSETHKTLIQAFIGMGFAAP